jgi:hypothetical protein
LKTLITDKEKKCHGKNSTIIIIIIFMGTLFCALRTVQKGGVKP